MISKFLENNPLFRECLEALQTNLLSLEESDKITNTFKKIVPLTRWGKVDWSKIDKKIDIGYDPYQIISALNQLIEGAVDKNVFIEWSDGGLPAIQANLEDIINHFDDVTCVAFEKFIFNPIQGYIIEILPGNKMTVGVINRKHNNELSMLLL